MSPLRVMENGGNPVRCGGVCQQDSVCSHFACQVQAKDEDIMVGHIVEVVQKRWTLEINFSQDVVLMLSLMNLSDGIQVSTLSFSIILLTAYLWSWFRILNYFGFRSFKPMLKT